MTYLRVWSGLSAMVAFYMGVSTASAQQASYEEQVQIIRETAKDICNTVKEAKGQQSKAEAQADVKAQLGGLFGKLFPDVGASAGGKVTREQFEGLSQEATAAALKSDQECRRHIFDEMYQSLRPALSPSAPALPPSDKELKKGFYRRLENDVKDLEMWTSILSKFDYGNNPNYAILQPEISKVVAAAEPVCQARSKVAELGDTEILEQLNRVCGLLEWGKLYNEHTAGASAWIHARLATQFNLVEILHNSIKKKLSQL